VYHLKYSNDGKWLMSSGMDAVIKRWNLVDTSQKPIVFRGHRSWVRSFDVSPDGKWFVSAGNDANILHWKMDSTVPLRQVAWAHKAPLSTIRLVPNSRFAATAGYDNGVKLFDLAVLRRVKIFDGHTGPVVSLDVSPDGRRIATVSNDKTLRLWSVGLGTEIIHFDSPDSMFDAVAFSPDGKKLATGSRNGIVHLWGLPRLSEAELEEQLPNFQDAGAEQNNSVMAVAGKLPLIEVLKPDDEPKWSVIPVDSAAKINGLRFMSPFKTDADMIFAFVVHPSNFSWNIAKADGSRMTTFRSFSKLSNVDFEGIDVPLENTTILQNHIGGHIKAGQEYVIWFKFPVRPSQFHAMVKLFPRTDKDKGSRQFIQQPRFVAKELGLAWPFKYKTTGFEFVPTNR